MSALIDSGASVSVLPSSCVSLGELEGASPRKLYSVTGEELKLDGVVSKEFLFEGEKFKWEFIVSKVQTAILGAYFLSNFDIVVVATLVA